MSISYCETECLTQDARMKIMQRFCISFPLWGWPRRRNGMRQVDVKMPEMDEQECSVEAFLEVNTLCKLRYIWFRGIQNRKRHSESKQLWDIRICYIVPAGNISGWFPAWPVLYFNGSMRRKRGCQCGRQYIEPMQSNTLCTLQCRMPGSALDIYAYVDNETPEEEQTKKIIAGLDCWIAGLLAVEQLL